MPVSGRDGRATNVECGSTAHVLASIPHTCRTTSSASGAAPPIRIPSGWRLTEH